MRTGRGVSIAAYVNEDIEETEVGRMEGGVPMTQLPERVVMRHSLPGAHSTQTVFFFIRWISFTAQSRRRPPRQEAPSRHVDILRNEEQDGEEGRLGCQETTNGENFRACRVPHANPSSTHHLPREPGFPSEA